MLFKTVTIKALLLIFLFSSTSYASLIEITLTGSLSGKDELNQFGLKGHNIYNELFTAVATIDTSLIGEATVEDNNLNPPLFYSHKVYENFIFGKGLNLELTVNGIIVNGILPRKTSSERINLFNTNDDTIHKNFRLSKYNDSTDENFDFFIHDRDAEGWNFGFTSIKNTFFNELEIPTSLPNYDELGFSYFKTKGFANGTMVPDQMRTAFRLSNVSSVSLNVVTSVPEPSTIAIFAISFLGIASRKRKILMIKQPNK
jgi:hypothetical protein